MDERMADRLRELRAEFAAGQRMLAEMAEREAALRQSMLRISGAIAVLEELSADGARMATREPALAGG